MTKVLLDISKLGANYKPGGTMTGIGRVVESLAAEMAGLPGCELKLSSVAFTAPSRAFLEAHPTLRNVPFSAPTAPGAFTRLAGRAYRGSDKFVSRLPGPLSWPGRLPRRFFYNVDQQWRQSGALFDLRDVEQADVFHSTLHPLPAVTQGRLARFITVYDVIPQRYPQFFQVDNANALQAFFQEVVASIADEDWVICPSVTARDDFCDYSGRSPQRTAIIPLAADSTQFHPCTEEEVIAAIRSKYGIPEGRYVLSVCKLEPRKNLGHVIAAFAELLASENIRDLHLVLAGSKAWDFPNLERQVSELQPAWVREHILFAGHVDEADLSPLYSGAMAFACLSLAEGFGLPPLEAMQCGTPVIAANATSLPEVVGDAGLLVAPQDRDELARMLLSLYNSSLLRDELSQKSLSRAATFSWQRCAEETLKAYRAALGEAV